MGNLKFYILIILIYATSISINNIYGGPFIESNIGIKWHIFNVLFPLIMIFIVSNPEFCSINKHIIIKHFFLSLYISTLIQLVVGYWFKFIQPTTNSNFPIIGTYDNPIGYACSLAILVPIVVIQTKCRNHELRFINILILIILILSIIHSQSRTTILGVGIILLYTYTIKTNSTLQKTYRCILLILIICIVLIYIGKINSALGRIGIWHICFNMLKETPIIGYGTNGFHSQYMKFQAMFFEKNPNSTYTFYADSIQHPMNEYLYFVINYGILGVLGVIFILYSIYQSRKNYKCPQTSHAKLTLILIAIIALFSYPFRYPYVIWILITSLIIIWHKHFFSLLKKYITKITTILISIYLIFNTFSLCVSEIKWYYANMYCTSNVDIDQVYPKLYSQLQGNRLFMYNYAAKLHKINKHHESNIIAHKCSEIWNDYYLELIIADNYEQTSQYKKAIDHYKIAHYMCPNRIFPMYKISKIFLIEQDTINALHYAKKVINSKIKIESEISTRIKNEMTTLLKTYE